MSSMEFSVFSSVHLLSLSKDFVSLLLQWRIFRILLKYMMYFFNKAVFKILRNRTLYLSNLLYIFKQISLYLLNDFRNDLHKHKTFIDKHVHNANNNKFTPTVMVTCKFVYKILRCLWLVTDFSAEGKPRLSYLYTQINKYIFKEH